MPNVYSLLPVGGEVDCFWWVDGLGWVGMEWMGKLNMAFVYF